MKEYFYKSEYKWLYLSKFFYAFANLSTVGQMCLCFTEVFIFSALSIISWKVDLDVFYVIFILSIVSTLDINILMREK